LPSISEKDIFVDEAMLQRPEQDGRDSMSQKRPIIPHDFIRNFCRRHHIRKLSIFGSYLSEDFGPESDIDFLVEFDQGHIPTLFDVAGMEIELSEPLGRKVDLRTAEDLSRYFRDEVVAQAEVQYAEG
jgi:predicted nucleotidyltransferase